MRDLGDRVFATGLMRTRGRESGAATESPVGTMVDIANGKTTRVRTFLSHDAARAAAGLSE